MGYTIFTRQQITELTMTINTEHGRVTVPNPGAAPVYPLGATLIYTPPTINIYSASSADRQELLRDPAGTATNAEIFAAFPLIREPKKADIRAAGSKWLDYVTGEYSDNEKATFTTQQRQAEEWLKDNNSDCLTIRAMAAGRGITIAEMVAKIIENVPAYESGLGVILGKQQRLLAQINAVADYDELSAIKW